MPTLTCTRYHCGEPLVERHDRSIGKIGFVCLGCERTKAGRCRDCPTSVRGHQLRCPRCSRARTSALDLARKRQRANDPRLHAIDLRRKRAYNASPAACEKTRARNASRPHRLRDAGDRQYHKIWMREARKDPAWRERYNAQRRARYAARKAVGDPVLLAGIAKSTARQLARYHNDPAYRAKANARRVELDREKRRARQRSQAVAA